MHIEIFPTSWKFLSVEIQLQLDEMWVSIQSFEFTHLWRNEEGADRLRFHYEVIVVKLSLYNVRKRIFSVYIKLYTAQFMYGNIMYDTSDYPVYLMIFICFKRTKS